MNNQYIGKAMREKNDNAYRNEQMRATKIIRDLYVGKGDVIQEYSVSGLTIDGKPYPTAKPDIAIPKDKIIIRLMGPPHKKKNRKDKDWFQKTALEALGWIVIDFWYDLMPNLWEKDRCELNDQLAIIEVMEKLEECLD